MYRYMNLSSNKDNQYQNKVTRKILIQLAFKETNVSKLGEKIFRIIFGRH